MAEKMLVTQGLNELKTLNSRIIRAIEDASFITASKVSEKNAAPGVTKEDFATSAKASYQSIQDLIARREKIKAAIIASNAVTEVEIAGEKMTVAKAIDTKNSISFMQELLNMMTSQYHRSLSNVNNHNAKVDEKIDSLITNVYGKDGKEKISENDYNVIAAPYKSANEFGLVDPLNLKNKIDELSKYIEDFSSNVDAQLQISNCITTIEI